MPGLVAYERELDLDLPGIKVAHYKGGRNFQGWCRARKWNPIVSFIYHNTEGKPYTISKEPLGQTHRGRDVIAPLFDRAGWRNDRGTHLLFEGKEILQLGDLASRVGIHCHDDANWVSIAAEAVCLYIDGRVVIDIQTARSMAIAIPEIMEAFWMLPLLAVDRNQAAAVARCDAGPNPRGCQDHWLYTYQRNHWDGGWPLKNVLRKTGRFFPVTIGDRGDLAVVGRLQRRLGVTVDGIAGPKTWHALQDERAKRGCLTTVSAMCSVLELAEAPWDGVLP